MRATAVAHPNVALVKYWGKRDARLNLPAVGSISVTLAGLATRTSVSFEPELSADSLVLNGTDSPKDAHRVSRFLDVVRKRAGTSLYARVQSTNDFPTGAGLASSASAYAALALAATRALGMSLSQRELSALARRGSGSAARSIFGGYVEMHRGERDDGEDAVAEPLLPGVEFPLAVLVAVTHRGRKDVDSTEGMESSRDSSAYYPAWVDGAPQDLARMREAIRARDIEAVGTLAEHSCLKMHALALSGTPPLIYWNATTVALMHGVRTLRRQGRACYFTIDAGPQVKVLCHPGDSDVVRAALTETPGVYDVLVSGPGEAAVVVP